MADFRKDRYIPEYPLSLYFNVAPVRLELTITRLKRAVLYQLSYRAIIIPCQSAFPIQGWRGSKGDLQVRYLLVQKGVFYQSYC